MVVKHALLGFDSFCECTRPFLFGKCIRIIWTTMVFEGKLQTHFLAPLMFTEVHVLNGDLIASFFA
jgi:hypothetical protein